MLLDRDGNDKYRKGGFYRIDDRDGSRQRNYDTRKEWSGGIVSAQDWEARNQQEFVRGKLDKQAVPDPRPVESVDNATFVGPPLATILADAPPGAYSVPLDSNAAFAIGISVRILLGNGNSFLTVITGIPDQSSIQFFPPLPSLASAGGEVISYGNLGGAVVPILFLEGDEYGALLLEGNESGVFLLEGDGG